MQQPVIEDPRRIQVVKTKLWKQHYRFLDGENEVLNLEVKPSLRSSARVTGPAGEWVFRRRNWGREISVESDLPAYRQLLLPFRWDGSACLTLDDIDWEFRRPSLWKSRYEWQDHRGNVHIQLHSNSWSSKKRGFIYYPSALPHTPFLSSLGWFLITAYESDSVIAVS